jgi:hypothetical protein
MTHFDNSSSTRQILSTAFIRDYLPGIAGISAVFVATIAWAIINFGSLYYAWLYAGGVRVTIDPPTVTVPDGKVGEARDAVFVIRNLSNRPVKILGVTTSCTCITTDALPLLINAMGSKELHATLRLTKSPTGRTEQNLTYHTDHPAAPALTVKARGRVEIEP